MDLNLIRTFMEVATTGSFAAASERLFVTQSAVSLRIQRLEDQLGRPLFIRSKAGAEMTPAGSEFEPFAQLLLRNWEQARQQVAIPQGFTRSITIGAQTALWPRLGFRWIDALREALPDLSIRAELGMPETLTRAMTESVMQIALSYRPSLRPGLRVEKVMDEALILVASWPEPTLDQLPNNYAFVDWSPEFLSFHELHLPHLTNPGLTLDIGVLSALYIINRRCAAYLPARYAMRYVEEGTLHLVPDAPPFAFPIWSVWREDLDDDITAVAKKTLQTVVHQFDDAAFHPSES
ncbi:LysR family transcriptional regulator [Pseudorhodobacter turbinis]|uniref:LysR family transcriptional regulator n=1 Tax=Pseudorhodobacter turbinis TaxID=2500533 RepID=A0A4V1E0X5_9RHOB|nr:LysR family transcriptional regulator [Pseudorhodobacter turbinis]QCO56154.1 LysR family transcriptional regulator [Pseudorhodobacter turbinis]